MYITNPNFTGVLSLEGFKNIYITAYGEMYRADVSSGLELEKCVDEFQSSIQIPDDVYLQVQRQYYPGLHNSDRGYEAEAYLYCHSMKGLLRKLRELGAKSVSLKSDIDKLLAR